jgi:type VI secretion system secreted protein VgrG
MKNVDLTRTAVTRIAGTERLTRPYRFAVDIACPDPDLDLTALIAQPATLSLSDDVGERLFHGLILECSEAGRAAGEQFAYRLTLAPRLELLTLSRRNRTFGTDNPMSVIDVISAVLTGTDAAGLATDDFAFRLLKPDQYPKRDFWAQYEETDFDFIHRLLEHWGLFYFFEQEAGHERIVFTDSSVLANRPDDERTVIYDDRGQNRSTDDMIVTALSRRLRTIPARVVLKDYNPMTPNVSPSASSDVKQGTQGVQQEYGANFATADEGALFAKARAEEIAATRDLFAMTSTSPFIAVGSAFRLTRHFRRALNQGYFVTEVCHSGVQPLAGGFGGSEQAGPGYTAELVAIPGDSPYRSPRTIRRPMMAGVLPAVVEAQGGRGGRADLDEYGRYRVKLDFDAEQAPEFKRSSALRMAQPYAGPHTGMHFPLLAGTEVALGWVGGDPDRPLIMGAVPNAQTKSPTVKENHTENRIETASGMLLVMDDGPVAMPKEGAVDAKPPLTAPQGGGEYSGTIPQIPDIRPYAALVVPASDDTKLPHYSRLGEIAPNEPYETKIIAAPGFLAGKVDYRPTTLTSAAYAGQFTYTPYNMTTTIGRNETHVVGGDQIIRVEGNASLTVKGGTYTQSFGPAKAETWWVSTKADGYYYSATINMTPKISYSDTVDAKVVNGLSLAWSLGADLKAQFNLAGTFAHRVGPNISVSGSPHLFASGGAKPYGSSYSLSASGSVYKNLSGIDESHVIFGTEKIVLGFRGNLSGGLTKASLKGRASASVYLCGVSMAAAELCQALVKYKEYGWPDYAGQAAYGALGLGGFVPLSAAFVASTLTCVDYFNGAARQAPLIPTQKGLIENTTKEPTVTIDDKGITLAVGTSSIVVGKDEIQIRTKKLSIGILAPDGVTVRSQLNIDDDVLFLKANNIHADGGVDVFLKSGSEVELRGQAVTVSGPVTLKNDVKANATIAARGNVTAPNIKAG